MNFDTWCVQEQYWSYLKKYDTKQWQKVIIKVDDNAEAINKDFERGDISIDVIVLKRHFDIQSYLSLSKYEKKTTLLELLHPSMLHLANTCGWVKEPLFNAYEQCQNTNLEYRSKVKDKFFISPNRKLFGSVEWYWDIDSLKATGIITKKDGSFLERQLLLDIQPNLGETIYYCNCKWEDNNTFKLFSKDNKSWEMKLTSLV